jgi:hypothetical protein
MPPAYPEEIESNLDLLTKPFPDLPLQHSSSRATFEYSWDYCCQDVRRKCWKSYPYFQPFSREAAERIAGATPALLNSLVDKSRCAWSDRSQGQRSPATACMM